MRREGTRASPFIMAQILYHHHSVFPSGVAPPMNEDPSGFGNPKGLDVLAQNQRQVELV